MQGNYSRNRNHTTNSNINGRSTHLISSSSSGVRLLEHQMEAPNFNGLPVNSSDELGGHQTHSSQQQTYSVARYLTPGKQQQQQQQQQQHQHQNSLMTWARDFCRSSDAPKRQPYPQTPTTTTTKANSTCNNTISLPKHRASPMDQNSSQICQDQYSSQLRRVDNTHFNLSHQNHRNQSQMHQTQVQKPAPAQASQFRQMPATSEGARLSTQESSGLSQVQQPQAHCQIQNGAQSQSQCQNSSQCQDKSQETSNKSHHVNFNRSARSSAGDEEEDDSRKKKYLTAKYGQQQMNLIKKRLKIEMWLYEQLQDLAKGSKCEAELDEIDVDLDQLLDMDDDHTRRHWLKKTLEPFEDVDSNKIDKFIDEVLEQSKLL